MDDILQAFEDELEKIADSAAESNASDRWGKKQGKTWGMSSTKGGWATHFSSAGMQNMNKGIRKGMPKLKGTKGFQTAAPRAPAPPRYGEVNNQNNLRRNLSNVTLPKNVNRSSD